MTGDSDGGDGGSLRSEPAALRNRAPILAVLRPLLDDPATPPGAVIETAAGTGTHACFLAPWFADRRWLASDGDPGSIAAIAARIAAEPAANLLPPLRLDVARDDWAETAVAAAGGPIAAVVNVNMIHIAPWRAGLGLIAGAARLLAPGGVLYLYGPYRVGGMHTGPGNAAFDAQLRARNPAWGIRDVEAVCAAAASHGLTRETVVTMPADNRSVVFRRRS
jgi:SAM-dependent methyltransferase